MKKQKNDELINNNDTTSENALTDILDELTTMVTSSPKFKYKSKLSAVLNKTSSMGNVSLVKDTNSTKTSNQTSAANDKSSTKDTNSTKTSIIDDKLLVENIDIDQKRNDIIIENNDQINDDVDQKRNDIIDQIDDDVDQTVHIMQKNLDLQTIYNQSIQEIVDNYRKDRKDIDFYIGYVYDKLNKEPNRVHFEAIASALRTKSEANINLLKLVETIGRKLERQNPIDDLNLENLLDSQNA